MYVTNRSGEKPESTCRHCTRRIFQLEHGPWVDGWHIALCMGGRHEPISTVNEGREA
jgi:hypothetical protein